MRFYLKYLLCFSFLAIFLFSCKSEKKEDDLTTLSVTFLEPNQKEGLEIIDWYYNWREPLNIEPLIEGDRIVFRDSFSKGYYLLSSKTKNKQLLLYLEPSANTAVLFNGEKSTFEGDFAIENQFINTFRRRMKEVFNGFQSYLSLDKKDFIAVASSIEEEILEIHKKESEGVSEFTSNIEKQNAFYNLAYLKLEYIAFTQKTETDIQNSIVELGVKPKKKDLELFKYSDGYRDYLTNYYLLQIRPLITSEDQKKTGKVFAQYFLDVSKGLNDDMSDYIMTSIIYKYDLQFFREELALNQSEISVAFSSEDYKKEFQEIISEIEGLKTGSNAPNLIAATSKGVPFSWENYKGKPTVIDVWASWCGPCIRQIPALKALERKYGDKINIVGLSVDKDENAWENAINKYELVKNQFHVKDENSFVKGYGVKAIPHYIILDENTVVVNGRLGYIKNMEEDIYNPELIKSLDSLLLQK